jgi:exonuclease-1
MSGMGVKRAHGLIQRFKCHEKAIKHLRYSAGSVPPQYEANFKRAIWAFKFQRVYDPSTEDIVHLSGIPHDLSDDLDFLGPWLPQDVAKGIALGNIDPLTKEPFQAKPECIAPAVEKVYPPRESILPSNGRKRMDLPVQKNILTNYFCLASLEAKRKFRAPKITPKQHILDESSLPSTRIEDSSAPDSVEDTNLPTNHSQASQSSSEQLYSQPSPDVSAASQCSCERFSCEDPSDNSANISSQCSSLDGNIYPPPEDTCIEDKKVFVFHHFII